jgi:hypothetical protein
VRDPHVEWLRYKLEHSDQIQFLSPPPIEATVPSGDLKLVDAVLTVQMREHHSREADARAAVEPFLNAWELDASLSLGRDAIRFEFEQSRIVDRNPPPPGGPWTIVAPLKEGCFHVKGYDTKLVAGRTAYPPLPGRFVRSPDVDTMWHRYQMYLDGKEPLLSMAYACLTLLEGSTGTKHGARKSVCCMYNMDQAVRDKLGDLVSQKGSPEDARKLDYEAARVALSGREKQWVEEVIKALIRRKAEYDADRTAPLPQITMGDFVKL